MISIALIVLLSYLVGSIPGSILVGKHLYGIDPREHGSGNAGATNTMRDEVSRDGYARIGERAERVISSVVAKWTK